MCVQRRDGVPKSLITTDQAPPVPVRKREDTFYKRRHTRFAPQPSAHPLCQPTLNSLTNLNSIPPPSCTGSYRRISKRVFRGCRVPPIKAILSIPRVTAPLAIGTSRGNAFRIENASNKYSNAPLREFIYASNGVVIGTNVDRMPRVIDYGNRGLKCATAFFHASRLRINAWRLIRIVTYIRNREIFVSFLSKLFVYEWHI